MSTHVCELLGIEQPIVQAPMSEVPELAAAVSNAGALGMVALTWTDDSGGLVRQTAGLTERPFGGNFILTSDQHRRVDEALEAGLRIVSFMWGILVVTLRVSMMQAGWYCTPWAAPRRPDEPSRPAWTWSSLKVGKQAGTCGAPSRRCPWCPQ